MRGIVAPRIAGIVPVDGRRPFARPLRVRPAHARCRPRPTWSAAVGVARAAATSSVPPCTSAGSSGSTIPRSPPPACSASARRATGWTTRMARSRQLGGGHPAAGDAVDLSGLAQHRGGPRPRRRPDRGDRRLPRGRPPRARRATRPRSHPAGLAEQGDRRCRRLPALLREGTWRRSADPDGHGHPGGDGHRVGDGLPVVRRARRCSDFLMLDKAAVADGRVLAPVDGHAASTATCSTCSSTCTRCSSSGPVVERWYGSDPVRRVLPHLCRGRLGGELRVRRRRARRWARPGRSSACSGSCWRPGGSTTRSIGPVAGIVQQMGVLIVINIVFGFASGGAIDNAAHIGGLVAGLWLGCIHRPDARSRRWPRRWTVPGRAPAALASRRSRRQPDTRGVGRLLMPFVLAVAGGRPGGRDRPWHRGPFGRPRSSDGCDLQLAEDHLRSGLPDGPPSGSSVIIAASLDGQVHPERRDERTGPARGAYVPSGWTPAVSAYHNW